MGQSVVPRTVPQAGFSPSPAFDCSVFETACGWMALIGADQVACKLKIGYPDPSTLLAELDSSGLSPIRGRPSDWYPELRERLQLYANGKVVAFHGIRYQLPPASPFQQRVLRQVRDIPYGNLMTYGDVARRVGHPRAARAVGTVMANNPLPIIIPCHRVVAAEGRLGGYTSPQGVKLKQWLLDLERRARSFHPAD